MRARQLIDGAAFGPDALKAIGQAFATRPGLRLQATSATLQSISTMRGIGSLRAAIDRQ